MTEEQRIQMALQKPTVQDNRPVVERLLSSLRVSLGIKLRKKEVVPTVSIKGGIEF